MPRQFVRHNHFVPEGYLRAWSANSHSVLVYQLLVPRDSVPVWRQIPIRRTCALDHLYTSTHGGEESDHIEQLFHEKFELPSAEPLARLRADQPLSGDDWYHIQRYLFALDRRTLSSYFDHTKWLEAQLPTLIQRSFVNAKREIGRRRRLGIRGAAIVDDEPQSIPLPLETKLETNPEGTAARIVSRLRLDRQAWLSGLERALTHTVEMIEFHRWSVFAPYGDSEWYTSDRPVMMVRANGIDDLEFTGGWGRARIRGSKEHLAKGCEIIVPMSPRQLLYAKVGERQATRRMLSREETLDLQRAIAMRAHRAIIARAESKRAIGFRERTVDRIAYKRELDEEKRWHEIQS